MTTIESIRKADRLFHKAADAWERGNNSGDNDTLVCYDSLSDGYQKHAEIILKPLGITVDYPGLYPIYHYKDRDFYDAQSLISDVLREKQR